MFDCVMPTRHARHGSLFTTQGVLQITQQRWRHDFSPLDSEAHNHTSLSYSKAYLHHLFRCKERLGEQIASIHNLAFYLSLVKKAREKIVSGDFVAWKETMMPRLTRRIAPSTKKQPRRRPQHKIRNNPPPLKKQPRG